MILSVQSTVVVVPSALNFELFQQYWLVKNQILKESSSGFFTPVAIQASDDEIELLILQDRIQISSKDVDLEKGMKLAADRMQLLQSSAGGAMSPLKSAGLNAQVVLGDVGAPGAAICQTYLNPTLMESGSDVRGAGLYITQALDFGAVTTRVSAGVNAESGEEAVVLDINCHREIVGDGEFADLVASIEGLVAYCQRRITDVQADFSKGER